jgi:2-keto-3-deoxy-L-fuconate dehydrogenase
MNRLEGRKALITAAGQGIGRASALRFAAEGAEVWATDINESTLASLSGEDSRIRTRTLDVLDPKAIQACAQELGPVEILFNCAGYVHHGTVLECEEQDWDFSFDLNVKAMYRTIRAFLPGMLSQGRGSIVNMASVASSVKGVPNRFAYGASKAAVVGLTKAVAIDVVGQGIRCNAIWPGTVQSPSLDERIAAQGGDLEAVRAAFIARQPMGRIGTTEEIAALAAYLASDEASYTTGAIYAADGGMTI